MVIHHHIKVVSKKVDQWIAGISVISFNVKFVISQPSKIVPERENRNKFFYK